MPILGQRNLETLTKIIPIDEFWVSEGLEEYYRSWYNAEAKRQIPIFVDAPTGRGKNHFVFEKLIPYAFEQKSGFL